MKTDSLFYQIFKSFPATLFEIIGEEADAAQGYQFASVEVKQPTFRIDGVFRPSDSSSEKSIYFVEVQFQMDQDFYWRLFAEIFLYLEQEKPASNWQAVVLFAGANLDPGLPKQYHALRREHLTVLYLNALDERQKESPGFEMVRLIMEPVERAGDRGKKLLQRLREEPGSMERNQESMELVETILLYKFPTMSREEFEAMFQLEDLKHTRIYQEAQQEGKVEGKVEGKLEMVPLLISSGLSVERIAKETGLDVEAVRKAARASTNGAAGNGQVD